MSEDADGTDDGAGDYASPPCFMHAVEAGAPGAGPAVRPNPDVVRWRKAERERLIAARLAVPAAEREAWGERIAGHLETAIGDPQGLVVSLYWPFRGEPDLRPLMARLADSGARTALPVVVERGRPLAFRAWRAGERLERGVWNIPVPADGDAVVPQVVVAPVVGFDRALYRLGYGGGFFDRTLAALPARPRVFGVGYHMAEIATIHPQPHDIAMDAILTEAGAVAPAG